MRMIFTEDFTDDTRRLLVGLRRAHTGFLHGAEDAAMYRLQAIADIRQRAGHDDAHRVVDIGVPHLVRQIDRDYLTLTKIHNLTSYRNKINKTSPDKIS